MGAKIQETPEQRVIGFIKTLGDAVESLKPELRRQDPKAGEVVVLQGPRHTLHLSLISTVRDGATVPGVGISSDHAPLILNVVPQRFSRWSGLYNVCASWLPQSRHYMDTGVYPTECAFFETVVETVAARMNILPTTRLRDELENVCEKHTAQLKEIVGEPLRGPVLRPMASQRHEF